MIFRTVAVISFIAATSLSAPAMAQGKETFCREYANESVEMQSLNLEYGCGYTGIRWHTLWDIHFDWCRDWVDRNAVEEEAMIRRIQIERCSREDGRASRSSDHY